MSGGLAEIRGWLVKGAPESFVGSGEQMDGVGNKESDYVGSKGWRLPTEAEWEYACRAGTTTPRYGELDKIAWYEKNSGSTTHAVGQKQANAWGLFDMLGNVKEWCYDAYESRGWISAIDPVVVATKGSHVVTRGGSWISPAHSVRGSCRSVNDPTKYVYSLGFRVMRVPYL